MGKRRHQRRNLKCTQYSQQTKVDRLEQKVTPREKAREQLWGCYFIALRDCSMNKVETVSLTMLLQLHTVCTFPGIHEVICCLLWLLYKDWIWFFLEKIIPPGLPVDNVPYISSINQFLDLRTVHLFHPKSHKLALPTSIHTFSTHIHTHLLHP